jgi:hypothetical protein
VALDDAQASEERRDATTEDLQGLHLRGPDFLFARDIAIACPHTDVGRRDAWRFAECVDTLSVWNLVSQEHVTLSHPWRL